jgi:hypothetical protein
MPAGIFAQLRAGHGFIGGSASGWTADAVGTKMAKEGSASDPEGARRRRHITIADTQGVFDGLMFQVRQGNDFIERL